MVNSLSLSLVQGFFAQTAPASLVSISTGQAGSPASQASPASIQGALRQAERNEARQLEITARNPDVSRAIDHYKNVVRNARSLDEVLEDTTARRVLLTASGLSGQQDFVGLLKRALKSDPKDPDSLINRLGALNQAWLDLAKTHDFKGAGLTKLQKAAALETVSNAYIGERRLDLLDQQLPGLGSAVLFKRIAARLDSPIKILADRLGREVVTTALGLPKQMAVQSLQGQEKAIRQRLDPVRLRDPEFADRIAQRYLQAVNGGSAGAVA
jgi:hypothetical protein